jgi:selenocysteine lyase/cysteine desulfurase
VAGPRTGLPLLTPQDPKLRAGVVIIEVPSDKHLEVFNRLYDEHGIAASPTGGLRLSPHIYNTMEHIDRALRGVSALRRLMV